MHLLYCLTSIWSTFDFIVLFFDFYFWSPFNYKLLLFLSHDIISLVRNFTFKNIIKNGVKFMRARRMNLILEFIEKNQVCSYDDICNEFNISLSTARRDVNTLIKTDCVYKVYGGVSATPATSVSKDSMFSHSSSQKSSNDISAKLDTIGMLAASYVEPGDVIYIGSGATAYHILPFLKDIPDITIVTNNLLIAANDSKSNKEIILIGGKIDYYTQSTVGVQTIDTLKSLNINKAFVSCSGISLNKGFSNSRDSEIAIKKCIFENSETIFMIADSTKFDKISLYSFAYFNDINFLITDTKPNDDYISKLKAHNVSLIYKEN